MESTFLARQPIYDRELSVYAYELLYRSNEENHAVVADGDQATTEVVVNSMMDIGLGSIVGRRPAFINMTRGFLTGELPLPAMHEQVVLEVLEDISPDEELIAGLKSLAASGYQIALDDFVYRPELAPLVEIAHIIKLDILAMSSDELESHVHLLRDYPVKLLAEKVETQDDLERCQALDFDYYQGYFFCKPKIVAGSRPEGNRIIVLELMAKLQDSAIGIGELEQVIARDASLAYRLLRYVNSSFFGFTSSVESIQHALSLLGPAKVRQWASLILMLRLGDDKPAELLVTGMLRAKMCELVGVGDEVVAADQYFTVGLFSILDALMDMPLLEVLTTLPLTDEAKRALSDYSGRLGDTLRGVLDYEQGHWDRLNNATGATFQAAYLDALQWHRDSQQMLAS